MTDPHAAIIMDNILTLWTFGEEGLSKLDFHTTDEAFEYIAKARREHGIPLTVTMAKALHARGLLKVGE